MQDFEDDSDSDYEDFLKFATDTTGKAENITAELSATDLVDLQAIHDSVAELLKHFWICFPPVSPDMEDKVSLFYIVRSCHFICLSKLISHCSKLSFYH